MTKRNLADAAVAASLILTVIGVVISLINWRVDLPEPPPFKIVSSSPQRAYSITVERKRRKPAVEDWTSWKVYFSYASQGRAVLNEFVVSEGDSSSGWSFPNKPQSNWIYENTFRLSGGASLPESKSNLLLVHNDSADALSYLIVRGGSGESFYILNLAPTGDGGGRKDYARRLRKPPRNHHSEIAGLRRQRRFISPLTSFPRTRPCLSDPQEWGV